MDGRRQEQPGNSQEGRLQVGPGEPGRGDAAARSGRCAGGDGAAVPGVGGRRRVQRRARIAALLWAEDGGRDRAGGQSRWGG
jgi:hypothetical protein